MIDAGVNFEEYFTSPFPAYDATPEMAQAVADLEAAEAEKIDEMALTGYFSVMVVANMMEGLDEITQESVLAGMGAIDGMDLGIGRPFSTVEERATPGFNRLFDCSIFLFKIQGGAAVQVDGPTDVCP
jgi:hypothetical protein